MDYSEEIRFWRKIKLVFCSVLTVEELKNIPVLILYFVKDLSRICFKLKVYRKGSETNAKKKKKS